MAALTVCAAVGGVSSFAWSCAIVHLAVAAAALWTVFCGRRSVAPARPPLARQHVTPSGHAP
jgi:hypothetical protein